MATILDEIVEYKRGVVADRMASLSMERVIERSNLISKPRSLFDRLAEGDEVSIIAEIKKASPSKGLIREDFNPVEIGKIYEANGACGISVLTDEKYFQGADSFLADVHQNIDLPLLRKDFTVDSYQIYEARAIGASAVLLIVAALTPNELSSFISVSRKVDVDALVEVHTAEEAKIAVDAGADFFGINNRDLKTFTTDLAVTEGVIPELPRDALVVSESGIHTRADVERVRDAGADAILVGESLMKEADIGAKLCELAGGSKT
ncbi:MAG: indole-3-glycerol phosphate synthase TrpC [Candidatus Latescibacterota bacterium]|nr:indole-3-glycerol phosphate synthase TrpC [Candidatus Latescibacterota bacterium]